MKTIYDFDKIEVLKADGCNEKEAEKHLKSGTTIYTPEDYFSMLQDFQEVAEEHEIEKIEQIIEKCKAETRSGDTFFTEYGGVPCVIEYVL